MSDQEQRIRERAYALWETHGMPSGQAQDHWDQASREIAEEDQGRGESPPSGADQKISERARSAGSGAKAAKSKETSKSKATGSTKKAGSQGSGEAAVASQETTAASPKKNRGQGKA